MLALWWIFSAHAADLAATINEPGAAIISSVADGVNGAPISTSVRLLLILSAMSFIPAMLLVMTPFVRFVIVLSMLRQALGLAQSPPNQVIIGISLFLYI